MGYLPSFDASAVSARRAWASGETASVSEWPVSASIPIGSRISYEATDHKRHQHRPGLIMATYHLRPPHPHSDEYAALELAGSSTAPRHGRHYADDVPYRTETEIRRAGTNEPGIYKMSTLALLGNRRPHFSPNTKKIGAIDPALWPELIAARVDALLHNPARQEAHRQSVPDTWIRRGLVLDIPENKLADLETFAPDVPYFYPKAQRERGMERWYPDGLTSDDINTIIDLVATDGKKGRITSDHRYLEIMAARREALCAALPDYYAEHDPALLQKVDATWYAQEALEHARLEQKIERALAEFTPD